MHYWLMKSEPDEFSIDALKTRKFEPWTGVRNYQARNFMRQMEVGDDVFFYHSSCAVPGITGVASIVAAAYPDPTQFDPRSDYFDPKSSRVEPRWSAVDVKFKKKFKTEVTLETLKQKDALDGFALLQRGNRLSVLAVTKAQWTFILSLA